MYGKVDFGPNQTGKKTANAEYSNMEDQYYAMDDSDFSMNYDEHKMMVKKHDAGKLRSTKMKDYRQN